MKSLPTLQAPDAIWRAIEDALRETRAPARERFGLVAPLSIVRIAAAAAVVILAAAATSLWWWNARAVAPPAGWQFVDAGAKVARDHVVQTGADASVTLRVGDIGEVEVAPNTRVRLIAARDNENRLALLHGRISARILAPPRLFFVETPASTVVDLGCAYTMEADEDGDGSLRVTSGWASLEWAGRESLVPAGASCHTRPRVGPGTPCFDDASDALRRSLNAFDFDHGGDAALDVVLREARVRDTLTLWHLLSRVDGAARTRVFDRLVALTPLPSGVDRDKVMGLDRDSLNRWREELVWKW
jgi:hypothetical protein